MQSPENPASSAEVAPVTVFYEAALKRLDIQIGTFDTLDTKAWTALSIGSAILPIAYGLLGFSDVSIPWVAWVFLLLAGVAYGRLLWYVRRITKRTSRLNAGEPITILSDYVDSREFPGEGLQLWVARGYKNASIANERTLFLKAEYVGHASEALYAESLFLSIAAALTLLFG